MLVVLWLAAILGAESGQVTAPAATGGTVQGKIQITRPLTKKRINVEAYQNRGAALEMAGAPATDWDTEMDSVVVYAVLPVAAPATAVPGSSPLPEIRQKNRRFSRSLLVVPVGATVSFPNDDPIFHNVFSLSRARSFDLGYFPQGQTRTVRFQKPGVVDVFCHLHPNMSATVLVTPNEHFVQPGRDGAFSLSGLPLGEVEIVAWHRAAGFFRKRVSIPGPPVEFVLPLRN